MLIFCAIAASVELPTHAKFTITIIYNILTLGSGSIDLLFDRGEVEILDLCSCWSPVPLYQSEHVGLW